jgi:membrane-bound serine protease (ClpP class)
MLRIVLLCLLFCGACVAEEPLEKRLEVYIKYAPEGVNKVGRILINDRTSGINQGTWVYVKKALEHYKEQKPIFIILELNTPGGEVYAAQNISDALKEMDIQYNIPVVAYINNWAISAGAMLAYSSRFIAVTKDASMGAAEPVIAGTSGEMKEASEKVNSAMRSDMINRARFFDRNPLIAEAMVDKDVTLVLRDGKFVKLDNDTQIQPTDTIVSHKGKLLTLDSEKLLKYGVADFLVPPIKTQGKSALFYTPFFKEIPNVVIDEYQPDWKTQFFIFLANPIIASALFLGMMIGFYMEINMPGTSLPGTVAAICLFLIILSSFSQEIGNFLEVILLGVGILIVAVEIFVLPTFGLLGIVGVIAFLVGLFGLMLPGIGSINFDFDTKTLNAAGELFFERLALLGATFLIALIIMAVLSRYFFPKFAPFNRFVLKGNEQTDYLAVENHKNLPPIGTEGMVFATLRPAGKVVIEGKIYDALTRGSFIEKESSVIITGFEGGSIVVNLKENL